MLVDVRRYICSMLLLNLEEENLALTFFVTNGLKGGMEGERE